ncbi:6-phosphogluconate dehydrogenase%2Cdecarboxylating [Mycobacterium tuberculosis]|nr:6-phosphogluconate dehydrogenase%2Cdecarboxylating [Mycobacterium tuberculosis]
MQLGMIGLGRMGANIVRRLAKGGHDCVVYDHDPDAVKAMAGEDRTTGVASLRELSQRLSAPRVVWVMVPAGNITTAVIEELANTLEAGDIVIDGGNTYYRDDLRHEKLLFKKGIHLLDCGTSGGVWGRERGYCLMIGGDGTRSRARSRSSPPSRRGWRPPRAPRAETVRSRHRNKAICIVGLAVRVTS